MATPRGPIPLLALLKHAGHTSGEAGWKRTAPEHIRGWVSGSGFWVRVLRKGPAKTLGAFGSFHKWGDLDKEKRLPLIAGKKHIEMI